MKRDDWNTLGVICAIMFIVVLEWFSTVRAFREVEVARKRAEAWEEKYRDLQAAQFMREPAKHEDTEPDAVVVRCNDGAMIVARQIDGKWVEIERWKTPESTNRADFLRNENR